MFTFFLIKSVQNCNINILLFLFLCFLQCSWKWLHPFKQLASFQSDSNCSHLDPLYEPSKPLLCTPSPPSQRIACRLPSRQQHYKGRGRETERSLLLLGPTYRPTPPFLAHAAFTHTHTFWVYRVAKSRT